MIWCLAAEQVVQSCADRIDVRTVVEGFASNLFGGSEQYGAEERAALREVVVRASGQRFREPEVADLHATVGREEAVRRLDIAVEHAEAVGFGKPFDHVENVSDGVVGRQRAVGVEEVLERAAGHQLHDDVRPAGVGIRGEHEHTARMRELACKPTFLAEAFHGRRARCKAFREQLHGDVLTAFRRLGFVNGSHAAGADETQQAVATDFSGRRFGRIFLGIVGKGDVRGGEHAARVGRAGGIAKLLPAVHAERRRALAVHTRQAPHTASTGNQHQHSLRTRS